MRHCGALLSRSARDLIPDTPFQPRTRRLTAVKGGVRLRGSAGAVGGRTITSASRIPSPFERARAGDRLALERMYEEYAGLVYRTARRHTDSDEAAEDVMQDVFVGLPEMLSRFDGRGSFEGWLARITTYVALERLRRRKRPSRLRCEFPLPPPVSSDDGERVLARIDVVGCHPPSALRSVSSPSSG